MMKRQFSTAAAVSLLTVLTVMSPAARAAPNKAHGKVVYHYWCSPCHAPGPGHPGTQSLAIKYAGTGIPAVLEQRRDLTPALVKTMVRKGILMMAPFRKTEITDADLADLAAYLSKK